MPVAGNGAVDRLQHAGSENAAAAATAKVVIDGAIAQTQRASTKANPACRVEGSISAESTAGKNSVRVQHNPAPKERLISRDDTIRQPQRAGTEDAPANAPANSVLDAIGDSQPTHNDIQSAIRNREDAVFAVRIAPHREQLSAGAGDGQAACDVGQGTRQVDRARHAEIDRQHCTNPKGIGFHQRRAQGAIARAISARLISRIGVRCVAQ